VSATAAFEDTRKRVACFDAYCHEMGRDPGAVTRPSLVFPENVPEDCWTSVDAFVDFVGRYGALGIGEFIFDWPPDDRPPLVARLAATVLPAIRSGRGV
jgi:hypothetical protein